MRAVVIHEPGGLEVLELRDVPEPVPGKGEILVEVAAAGLNRADLLQRRGLYPPPSDAPQNIPGLEFSGTVKECGPSSSRFKVGDAVMGIVGGGAYAQRLVLHERTAMRVPPDLELERAAAVPEAFVTAFDALYLQADLRPGEHLLVLAVGSGVGTAAVQLGKLIGATVLGTARTEAKLRRAEPLGLAHGMVAEEARFAGEVKRLTGGSGADVVLDLVGGPYVGEGLRSLAPGGRHVLVGLVAGAEATVPLGVLLTRRLKLSGTVLRSRPLEEKIAVAQAFERQVVPHLSSRRLHPVVDEVIPMTEVRRAHERMEKNDTFGKIVLAW